MKLLAKQGRRGCLGRGSAAGTVTQNPMAWSVIDLHQSRSYFVLASKTYLALWMETQKCQPVSLGQLVLFIAPPKSGKTVRPG